MIALKLLNRCSFSKSRWLLSLLGLLWAGMGSAQQIGDGVYWVYFNDKAGNGYQMDQPGDFLSDRSIQRRAWQGLGVELTDEPLTIAYVDSLVALGADIKHRSRWLNGVAMVNANEELFQSVLDLSFTDTLPWRPESNALWFPPPPTGNRFEDPAEPGFSYDYGIAREQVEQLRMDYLHQKGYTGQGVWIGVLDAGFRNVDSLPSFESMISEGRLLGTRNFIDSTSVFRLPNTHGMYVLSIIGANWDENMMGTAPGASYFLCSTEDVRSETRIEELAWVEAAEYLDSLGVDVFNSSLGYSNFDSTLYDYTYKDMDGESTFCSRAASLLANKGIILSNSAGNQGTSSWYRITAPSDAKNVICVGAVDSTGIIANFSSRGPSFDGRVKPELVAMGRATGIQSIYGGVTRGSGTSYSAPAITGSVASLWQAYPEVPARELIQIIRNTGDQFDNPDATYGYGLPSFAWAFNIINSTEQKHIQGEINIYPNPASDIIRIDLPQSEAGEFLLKLYNMSGKLVAMDEISLPGEYSLPAQAAPGLYLLKVQSPLGLYQKRLIIR